MIAPYTGTVITRGTVLLVEDGYAIVILGRTTSLRSAADQPRASSSSFRYCPPNPPSFRVLAPPSTTSAASYFTGSATRCCPYPGNLAKRAAPTCQRVPHSHQILSAHFVFPFSSVKPRLPPLYSWRIILVVAAATVRPPPPSLSTPRAPVNHILDSRGGSER